MIRNKFDKNLDETSRLNNKKRDENWWKIHEHGLCFCTDFQITAVSLSPPFQNICKWLIFIVEAVQCHYKSAVKAIFSSVVNRCDFSAVIADFFQVIKSSEALSSVNLINFDEETIIHRTSKAFAVARTSWTGKSLEFCDNEDTKHLLKFVFVFFLSYRLTGWPKITCNFQEKTEKTLSKLKVLFPVSGNALRSTEN